ncbi:toxin-antitoxin system YwqK family antitoxin, partial [Parvicella tangerina]
DDKLEGMAYEYDSTGRLITIREYTSGFLRNEEVINRFDENGKKNGLWKEYYDNGELKWEGEFLHGELNGIVKEYTKKGALKTLEKYEFGSLDTESEEVVFFELEKEVRPDGSMLVGGYNNDMKQGIFREYDSTGTLISSYQYKDDQKLAEGMLDTAGARTGSWKYYYPTGELKAEGDYLNGIKVNEWKFYFKNGDIQQKGKYLNGAPHGTWTWWYSNGQVKREEGYRKGKEDGLVVEYDTLGNVLTSGEYIDGIQDGKWFYSVNDHTEEGEYRDDVRHGIWIYKYKDGTLAFKGEYINGLAIGKHKYYYPNGKIYWEGKYDAGLKDGEWTKYNEDGTISIQIVYKRGEEYKINGVKIKKIEG